MRRSSALGRAPARRMAASRPIPRCARRPAGAQPGHGAAPPGAPSIAPRRDPQGCGERRVEQRREQRGLAGDKGQSAESGAELGVKSR